jgi:hypothetical protein
MFFASTAFGREEYLMDGGAGLLWQELVLQMRRLSADSNHSSGPISASERAACMCAPVPWLVLRD